ncbi:hypothetical protein ABPG74_006757, partial [Tetrahymena malaccensis]
KYKFERGSLQKQTKLNTQNINKIPRYISRNQNNIINAASLEFEINWNKLLLILAKYIYLETKSNQLELRFINFLDCKEMSDNYIKIKSTFSKELKYKVYIQFKEGYQEPAQIIAYPNEEYQNTTQLNFCF